MNGKELVDLSQLPKAEGWSKLGVTQYQGYWFPPKIIPNIIALQQKYQAKDKDIILASYPKTGTTWLKALLFSIVNRARYTPSDTPLLSSNPHILVPFFEFDQSAHGLPLYATHIPYELLPQSVAGKGSSKCRIVYICRNPLDTITSNWNFISDGRFADWKGPGWTMDEHVEKFCRGESSMGPFCDHVLGFWNASLQAPEKVLFLKYEEILEDTASHVKRIAEFVGFPFSEDEEKSGTVEQIIELCSLGNLKELDVNKHGKSIVMFNVENKVFFRKGEIGDWINHLSPSMVENVQKVTEEKLRGSGLTFKYSR